MQDALFNEKGRWRPRKRVEMWMPEEDPSHRFGSRAEADVSPKGGAVRQGDKGKGREIRTLEDPHTI